MEELLKELHVDIACIQEIRLLPKDKTLDLGNYNTVRRDRPVQGEARGGGLLTFVKKTLPYLIRENAGESEGALESLSIEIPILQEQSMKVSN